MAEHIHFQPAQTAGARELERPSAPPSGRFGKLVDFIIKRRSFAEDLFWLLAALALATLLTWMRLAAGFSTPGVPLVFYLPVMLCVTLIAGWEFGTASLVLSVALVWILFIPPALEFRIPSSGQSVTLILWTLVSATQVIVAQFLRLALQHMAHSETRMRQLLSVASGLMWITDAQGRVYERQPGWSEITGMEWPRYGGDGWLNAIHAEDRPKLRQARKYDADRGYYETEVRLWNSAVADWRWYQVRAIPVPTLAGDSIEWLTALHEIHDQKLMRDKRDLVIGELRHRMKNLVTIIDALAKGSRVPDEPAVDAFLKKFSGRLHALGAAADLVLASQRVSIECGAVIRATLAPFVEENSARIAIDGPNIPLSEQTGGSLAMAMHELATNAVKYGALSVPEGRVAVTWKATPVPDGVNVVIEWRETGGPPPVAPNKEGFGGRVIRSVTARERNGDVRIDYAPEGVNCRIAFTKEPDGPPLAAE